MSKHQHKLVRSLTGEFIGWSDDRTPHRYIKLATASGEQTLKVAKSLRSQIQDWQPGISLHLLTQQRLNPRSGETTIKVKQLLTAPDRSISPTSIAKVAPLTVANNPIVEPTEIRVCQGSSCRRRGSEGICRAMQAYIADRDLTDRVEITTVKCLHQCKAAPHAIVTSQNAGILTVNTHYRQLRTDGVEAILARHLPIEPPQAICN